MRIIMIYKLNSYFNNLNRLTIMKLKFILSALIICCGMNVMAQDSNNSRRASRRGFSSERDAVVDTAIINRMNLDEKMKGEILSLQAAKKEEQKVQMEEMRKNGNREQRRSKEARAKMIEQRQAFKAAYRSELRKIMGDELYIIYLEKVIDQRQSFNPRGQAPNGANRGNRNNFGERGFGGGGFGEDRGGFNDNF